MLKKFAVCTAGVLAMPIAQAQDGTDKLAESEANIVLKGQIRMELDSGTFEGEIESLETNMLERKELFPDAVLLLFWPEDHQPDQGIYGADCSLSGKPGEYKLKARFMLVDGTPEEKFKVLNEGVVTMASPNQTLSINADTSVINCWYE